MVDIKKLSKKVNLDERTVKAVLEGFLKTLRTEYRDSDPIDYILRKCYCKFNDNYSVEQFENNYYEDKFHPVVKEYISELVDGFVEYAKKYGARLYKPYWEDEDYYEGRVKEKSKLDFELVEFCEVTNASDEVLTGIFNIALEKLTELGVAWGSVDEFPGACSDEPYYIDSSQWVFQSYEQFKRIMARVLYLCGESIVGWDTYEEYEDSITESDEEIVKKENYDYDKISDGMKKLLAIIVSNCEWVGNEKLMAYAAKFELELAGFCNRNEDDYLEVIAEEFIEESKQYVGKDFIETCRFLMHETKVGNNYCFLKYEKKFDDLSDSEKETVMKKVVLECISKMRHS